MLNWANQFNICCFLDNCNSVDNFHEEEVLLGVVPNSSILIDYENSDNWETRLNSYLKINKSWHFGHISYDFKDVIQSKEKNHPTKLTYPLLYLFEPSIVISLKQNEVLIQSINKDPNLVFKEITDTTLNHDVDILKNTSINISPTQTKENYLNAVEALKSHIAKGNCYEVNYCTQFFATEVQINPVQLFQELIKLSPTPFACFYKFNNQYVISASPERYLKKIDNKLISQPIKGTIKTNLSDSFINEELKITLSNSQKDKAENVMVVDLVRNDLSMLCEPGTVNVEELFGIYSFAQVHQMISTISGKLLNEVEFADILIATFPMGSMTGAPKHKVMQLIEEYEEMKRELYSGSIGYINPSGNFDFNVVIRSIFFNAETNEIKYKVGSGITHYSNANEEYDECLLKAKAIQKALKTAFD